MTVIEQLTRIESKLDQLLLGEHKVFYYPSIPDSDIKEVLILQIVCDSCGIHPDQVLSGKRYPEIVRAREYSAYLIYHLLRKNKTEIGRFFGQRHTSIISAIKRVENELEKNDNLKEKMKEWRTQFYEQLNKTQLPRSD